MKKSVILLGLGYLSTGIAAEPVKPRAAVEEVQTLEEVTVSSDSKKQVKTLFPKTDKATPKQTITAKEIEQTINANTAEDVIRKLPSVNVRKRYIGDPNGSLGMRASNVFQTAHSMVYGDGMPLHNPLRTSFNGAPRWQMVSPSEIDYAEVLYGPFSAEYSGNSFGGVVRLNTKMPEKFEMNADAMGIFQTMNRAGRKETLMGYKTFISAGNRWDKFSAYGSYNRLENEGQPMTPRAIGVTRATTGIRATGGEFQPVPTGTPGILYGDDGIQQSSSDLFKFKLGYDFTPDLQGRFTLAYEDREVNTDDAQSQIRNATTGRTIWGGAANVAGQRFVIPGAMFGDSTSERKTLNYGLNLKGKISDDWKIDTTASYYDAFRDRSVNSNFNSLDPANDNKGQVTDIKAWWASYDLKLATDKFLGRDDLSFMGGYQFNHASLNQEIYTSNTYSAATTDSKQSESGGATQTNSVFGQLSWRFLPDWEIMAGVRMDYWQTMDGHSNDVTRVPAQRVQNYANRDASRVSPKASLEYSPDNWTFRYSFSKAYRFPIAEEMFLSASRLTTQSISYPGLGPENGYFNNFMVKYDIPRGFVQADVFYNVISDEINNSSQFINGINVTTFLPIDKTESVGIDLIFQQRNIFNLPIDLNINGTWIQKRIIENSRNTALVGNQWDRIPKLQANATATYHILPVWDAAVGVRYRSDVYQTITNTDIASNVVGGTDEYTFVDFKTSYQLPAVKGLTSTISAGIDNILNQDVFENHPFPQRTYFVNASFKY